MALEIFKLMGSIYVDNDKANESIAKTDKNAQGVGKTLLKGVGTAAKWGAGIATAAGAGAAALTGVAMKSSGVADNIDKMSQKIGISKQGFQEWSYIMGQNGMDVDKLQVGMKTLVTQMDMASEGNKNAIDTFDKLSLSWEDGSGKLKSQEEMMNEALYSLAEMENGTEKARIATELFGKSGVEMMPMLNGGAKGMEDLKNRAHDLGLVLSDDTVNAGVVLGDTMDDVKDSLGMLGTKIGGSLMPILQTVLDVILANLPMIQGLFESLSPIIADLFEKLLPPLMQLAETLFPVILELIETLLPIFMEIVDMVLPIFTELLNMLLPPLVEIVQVLLPPLLEIVKALMPILNLIMEVLKPIIELFTSLISPIIDLVMTAITPLVEMLTGLITTVLKPIMPIIKAVANVLSSVLGTAFKDLAPIIDNIMGIFGGLIDFISGVFTGNWEKAFGGLKDIVKNIFDALINIVKTPINWIIKGLNAFIGGLNKLKIPDWVPGVGGKGINIPTIPLLAKGGTIYKAGQAIVGDAGPELLDLPSGAKVTPLTGQLGGTEALDLLGDILLALKEDKDESITVEHTTYFGDDKIYSAVKRAKKEETKRRGYTLRTEF